MEEVIRKYVDECWGFVQEHREYLMYVPSYEEHIEPEMQDTFDNIIPQGKSVKIYVTQPEHTNYMVDIITEKDHVWKAIDNQISSCVLYFSRLCQKPIAHFGITGDFPVRVR